jgi:hypothetical protein
MAKGEFRVLVPGCGLGRLAMEVAALGESRAACGRESTGLRLIRTGGENLADEIEST